MSVLYLTKAQAKTSLRFYPWTYKQTTCPVDILSPHCLQVYEIKKTLLRKRVGCYVDTESGQVLCAWIQRSRYRCGVIRVPRGDYKGSKVFYVSETTLNSDDKLYHTKLKFVFPPLPEHARKTLEIVLM